MIVGAATYIILIGAATFNILKKITWKNSWMENLNIGIHRYPSPKNAGLTSFMSEWKSHIRENGWIISLAFITDNVGHELSG